MLIRRPAVARNPGKKLRKSNQDRTIPPSCPCRLSTSIGPNRAATNRRTCTGDSPGPTSQPATERVGSRRMGSTKIQLRRLQGRIPLRLRLRHGEGWSRSLALPFALNPWTTTDSTRTPHPGRRAERCPSGSPHTTRKRAETTTAGPCERADGSRSIRRPGIRQK